MLEYYNIFLYVYFFGIAEAIRRLRIQTSEKHDDGGGAAHTRPFPDRPGEPDCSYYMRTGTCSYGPNCRFNHPSNLGQVTELFNIFSWPEVVVVVSE